MNIIRRHTRIKPFVITIHTPHLTTYGDLDGEKAFYWTLNTALFISVGIAIFCVASLAIHAVNHKNNPAPQSPEQAFITSCENNTVTIDQGNDRNPGVPNVTVHPWTCTYAR